MGTRRFDGIPRYAVRFDHGDLLVRPAPGAGAGAQCDAVVVPTHDARWGLDSALDLAEELRCTLLVLCSQGREAGAERAAARPGCTRDRWVLALPHGGPSPRLGARPIPWSGTWQEPGARATKYRDLALKRSTALAVARMLGWRTVLFLDDDIRGLPAQQVADAAATLSPDGAAVASWRTTDFPDNSAVCHAGRLVGTDQGVFVGSGAMVVRVDARPPLFPPVYNEDWCFLFDALTRRQVLRAGDVHQLEYDPFDAVANRGGNEEFGDILGEGLFHLLHHGYDVGPASRESYWPGVVAARREFILRIRDVLTVRLDHATSPSDRVRLRAAAACLDQALRQHGRNLSDLLASFVRSWRADLETWHPWFEGLPHVGDVRESVRLLGWPPEHIRRVDRS